MPRQNTMVAAVVAAVAIAASGAALADWWQEPESTPAWPVADGFDFPIGGGEATDFYDAQPYGVNQHLGEDWNGLGGSDLGRPVTAIGAGIVRFAEDVRGGWGNVVRVEHRYRDADGEHRVESLYAHLHRIDVAVGSVVRRGDVVGTVGDAHGRYQAHLHLELRERPGMPLGGGYSSNRSGYLAPTPFLRAHRPR